MNFTGKINLLKLDSTGIVVINGKSGSKKCVVIPIEENDIFVPIDESTGKAKGAYLGLNMWHNNNETGLDQYGNSHSVKQSFSQQYRESKSEEEMRNKPFLGNMKPLETINNISRISSPLADVADNDDLPF